jgi:hypothetical protein
LVEVSMLLGHSELRVTADPEAKAPVYDEMAQVIRNRFQADNLVVRSGVRIKARS